MGIFAVPITVAFADQQMARQLFFLNIFKYSVDFGDYIFYLIVQYVKKITRFLDLLFYLDSKEYTLNNLVIQLIHNSAFWQGEFTLKYFINRRTDIKSKEISQVPIP